MDERTPLLRYPSSSSQVSANPNDDVHTQFCILAGITPSNLPKDAKWPKPSRTSIYQRAKRKETSQGRKYIFTATLTNSLLLSQIVIGATLTALGASNSPSIYVALFGALNTVIAGLVTYLKSRGQPMRSRMFRDDLERVIDEVENSETMWLGIASRMHGYSAIDTEDKVSVRSEVARLTRLYDEAVRNNTNNNPDLYLNQSTSEDTSGLKARSAAAPVPASGTTAAAATSTTPASDAAPTAPQATDSTEAPATASKPSDTPPMISKDDGSANANGNVPAPDTTAAPNSNSAPASNSNNDQRTASPTATAATAPNPPEVKPLTTDIDEGPVTMDIPDKKPAKTEDGGT